MIYFFSQPLAFSLAVNLELLICDHKIPVIAPGFHSAFLEAMVKVFTDCSERTVAKFEKLIEGEHDEGQTIELDLEAEFSSLALDVIGLAVFNYDFGSVTEQSPVIKV